ncbi:MAG: SgcJ/EcaC family oxidoreductase [Steroidobacteraceae bacterium]|jgi:uncharacterized protein (TIGR02246 family)|nr:SgcJ/EcaC family oxidoreductase [Steroidobacteraceae bacterium]
MPAHDQEIVSTYAKLLAAWNAQDAAGMAELFAEGGAQVGFDGSEAQGPQTIRQQLAPIFRDHPTKRFVHVVREVRRVTDDVFMLRAVAGMVPRDSLKLDESKNVVQTLVVRKEAAGWRIVLFQNTPAKLDGRPEAVAAMSEELRAAAEHQLDVGSP